MITTTTPSATGAGSSRDAIAAKFEAFRHLREIERLAAPFTAVDLDKVIEMRAALQRAEQAIGACQDALERENSRVVPDDDDGFRVVYRGRLCSPAWVVRGAAEVYLGALLAGTRSPEYEDVSHVMR